MKTSNLLRIVMITGSFIVNLSSCKDESIPEPDIKCDTYFLASVHSSSAGGIIAKLNYNGYGKLERLETYGGMFPSALNYHYDANQRIETMTSQGFGDVVNYFVFDDNGKLLTTYADLTNAAIGTIRMDSLTFEYDASGLVSKVNSFEYKYPATLEHKGYKTFEYSGNQVIVKSYYFENTWHGPFDSVFTIDSNPNPYPVEYYYAHLRDIAPIFPEHNVLFGPATYNDDGYPTKIGDLKFTYSCTP
jgi:hypothetical protein